jgi:hypothetical protein
MAATVEESTPPDIAIAMVSVFSFWLLAFGSSLFVLSAFGAWLLTGDDENTAVLRG